MAAERCTLRFIICGSVGDGKSTLIGRLLYESKSLFYEQLAVLEDDPRQYGTQGGHIYSALPGDGLQAKRGQGIDIDVAYCFFATAKRRFIVADTPRHEQYASNMATGASAADVAVILIDARKGVSFQARRQSLIAAMMGIRHVVLAVNKMDLVGYRESIFNEIVAEFQQFAEASGFLAMQAIPLSALEGANVVAPCLEMSWYKGPSLLAYLDAVETVVTESGRLFRMPVQWVNSSDPDFRGYCGRVAQGGVRPGDAVRILPSGVTSMVKEVMAPQGSLEIAAVGDTVTLTLADEVEVSHGDMIVSAEDPPQVADQFEAHLLWMSDRPLVAGRPYLLKLHAKEVAATVSFIKYREDINSGAHLAAKSLGMNEIGVVTISLGQAVAFEPYSVNPTLGGFTVIDKLSQETVGAGMIDFALRRSSNIHWQALEVGRAARAEIKQQEPCCIWFTGLSGSGKSTIANLLEKRLHAEGRHTYLLDGDNVRHGLNRDLGFTEADRVENIRRIAEVSRLMVDAGLIVLVSFISPYRSERQMARELFAEGEFVEVFVDTPLAECERRDPKGLYAKVRRGELKNFTGVDSSYEPPEHAEVHLDSGVETAEVCMKRVLAAMNGVPRP